MRVFSTIVDGEFKRVVRCPRESISLQLLPDEDYIEGEYHYSTHTLVDGEVVERKVKVDPLSELKASIQAFNIKIEHSYEGNDLMSVYERINKEAVEVLKKYMPLSEYTFIAQGFAGKQAQQWIDLGESLEEIPNILRSWHEFGKDNQGNSFNSLKEAADHLIAKTNQLDEIISEVECVRIEAAHLIENVEDGDYTKVTQPLVERLRSIEE